MDKKGQVSWLGNTVTQIGGVAVTIGVVLMILAKFLGVMDAGTNAYNAVAALIDAIGEIPGWVPIIIIVVIGAFLMYMMKKNQGNG